MFFIQLSILICEMQIKDSQGRLGLIRSLIYQNKYNEMQGKGESSESVCKGSIMAEH